ncbi:MAG TPA: DUF5671 domain-containing protein [Cryobacterium sp.]|nr:DUF5671 domain-containing protein [Cryobacterium sp.]
MVGVVLLVAVVVIGAGIAGIVIAVRKSSPHGESTAQPTVRRVIVFVLLFALVVIAAIGVSGLLGRLLDAGTALASSDVTGLARSLAFTLIAGPFAAVLWWVLWRRMDGAERSSVAWGLYLAGLYTVSLITFSTALLTTAAVLVRGDWQPRLFATGVVWAGVWVWHRWMSRHREKSPTRLVTVAPILSSVFGLVIAVGGAVTALSSLLDAAVDTFAPSLTPGEPWWQLTAQALIWFAGGVVIWWWHWIRSRARDLRGGLADPALVAIVAGAAILALSGAGTVLFLLLRLAFDRTDPITDLLALLGFGISAAFIGALVWSYHRSLTLARSDATRLATKLVTSGVGLVVAASGLGVVVNSILAATTTPLAGSGTRTLLLGGISALVVGGPVWWLAWQPTKPLSPAEVQSTGRRVYLILVFGLSAVVAIVTLLVIGYRLFEFALGDFTGDSLVDRVRAPLGLLVATGLAAGYHFAVWRRDRALSAAAPQPARTIGRVILVTDADPEPLSQAIGTVTGGAAVSVLKRADGAGTSVTAEQLAQALTGVTGKRVLVLTGPGDRVEVIPLEE